MAFKKEGEGGSLILFESVTSSGRQRGGFYRINHRLHAR